MKKIIKSMLGWKCQFCDTWNMPTRSRCKKCDARKPE